jgi:two-component system, NtrC family, sensor kinase
MASFLTHPPSPNYSSHEGVDILVVEDEAAIARLYAELLKPSAGSRPIRCAGRLTEALSLIAEETPDVVILDLGLPDSTQFEGLEAIRKACPSAAIIITTGLSDEQKALEGLRNGAEDYLFKGEFDGTSLNRSIRHALERSREAERVRVSQALLASTLDAFSAFIAILDSDGRIMVMNQSWEQFSIPGNPFIQDCRIGMDYKELCRDLDIECGPFQTTAHGLLEVLEGRNRSFRTDYDCPTGDHRLWFEVLSTRFETSGTPCSVVVHSDTTDRMQFEDRLRVSEGFFSIIINNMVDLLAIIDAKGERAYTSPSYSQLLGYTKQELESLGIQELAHPDDLEKIRKALKDMFEAYDTGRAEYRLRHKEGHYLYFDSVGNLIPVAEGEAPRAIVVARNISQRKAAEEERVNMEVQLRHAQKLESIGQLAAGIAHEINTPSQYIGDNLIFLEDAFNDLVKVLKTQETTIASLRRGDNTDESAPADSPSESDTQYLLEEIPKAIAQCEEGLSRVARIVGAMKDFSHPDSDAKTRVDLNRAIQSTATVCRNEWKYVAELELDLDAALPPVPCYLGEFNQAILNLVINAAHAIGDAQKSGKEGKGVIRIQTHRAGDNVEVRVEDTGTGIPEQIRERIFDPFFTTKPVGKGTGQGLAIVHSVIVEKHGGHVSLESEMGKGSAFILQLPLEDV